MALWIPVAIVSYFLAGLAAVFDKILLGKRLPDPLVFTFFTGITSLGVLILAPFGFSFISLYGMVAACISGVASLASVYFLYQALRKDEASRVVPLVGLASPLFILSLNYIYAREHLQSSQFGALFFFIAAGIFLTIDLSSQKSNSYFKISTLFYSLASAFFLALTLFYAKVVFDESSFISGFIWTRLWAAFAAVVLLVLPRLRERIFLGSEKTEPSSYAFFAVNKVTAALGFILQSYAIKLGPVSIINAMRGLENLFVFLFALFLTIFFPLILRESLGRRSVLLKIMGVFLASVGFMYLSV